MKLNSVHLLLTYSCNYECDHCFVWSSPNQPGTMTLGQVEEILRQAKELGTVEWIYFEGGEPFLYYAVLLEGIRAAAAMGFHVGIVSNGYWATDERDAEHWLRPLAGMVQDLSISSDFYHGGQKVSPESRHIRAAAERLGIPVGVISIAQPQETADPATGKLPAGESSVMYRGRAAEKLSATAVQHPWRAFTCCPYENLREPGRVHIDPLGYLHICQGISLGNVYQTPMKEICAAYDPDRHPITSPLLDGGPAELVRRHDVPHDERYADACHLCYATRRALRQRYPEILAPDQMYGLVANT
ncbi:MAG: radical SAM protein [Planctomycetota bacterium]|jgi:MoaA/NifB/PqqE/SkfB family radical SAM enzyme